MTAVPPDPGDGSGGEYLEMALAARPEVDRLKVFEKIHQVVNPRPGVARDVDNVMLDVGRRLCLGLPWDDIAIQLPRSEGPLSG